MALKALEASSTMTSSSSRTLAASLMARKTTGSRPIPWLPQRHLNTQTFVATIAGTCLGINSRMSSTTPNATFPSSQTHSSKLKEDEEAYFTFVTPRNSEV